MSYFVNFCQNRPLHMHPSKKFQPKIVQIWGGGSMLKTAILLPGGFPDTSHIHTSVYCGRLQFYIVAKLYPHTDPMVAREPWFLSRSSCHRILNFVFAYFFPPGSLYSGFKKDQYSIIPIYQCSCFCLLLRQM